MDWSADKAIEHLRSASIAKGSTHECAKFTREAIEAGFVGNIRLPRPAPRNGVVMAKDYGPSLQAVGFMPLPEMCGGFKRGDVVIVEGFSGHSPGHMAMFDGKRWISDFWQNNYTGREGGVYPGSAYQNAKPNYRFYRYRGISTR
jgi:hypothetical protein